MAETAERGWKVGLLQFARRLEMFCAFVVSWRDGELVHSLATGIRHSLDVIAVIQSLHEAHCILCGVVDQADSKRTFANS